jgi:hypothetical protein
LCESTELGAAAIGLFARTTCLSPLVTYLDSHPEQYLVLSDTPAWTLLRLDIQNKGRREFAVELGKAILRSSLAGKRDADNEKLVEHLVQAAVDAYNATEATWPTLDPEEQLTCMHAAHALSGLAFLAKYDPVHDAGQRENLAKTLVGARDSYDAFLSRSQATYDLEERKTLIAFQERVFNPLCASSIDSA